MGNSGVVGDRTRGGKPDRSRRAAVPRGQGRPELHQLQGNRQQLVTLLLLSDYDELQEEDQLAEERFFRTEESEEDEEINKKYYTGVEDY